MEQRRHQIHQPCRPVDFGLPVLLDTRASIVVSSPEDIVFERSFEGLCTVILQLAVFVLLVVVLLARTL